MMKLKEYLMDRQITVAEFAVKIGRPSQTVYRYINGSRIPDKRAMLMIKSVTGGEVNADSFYQNDDKAA